MFDHFRRLGVRFVDFHRSFAFCICDILVYLRTHHKCSLLSVNRQDYKAMTASHGFIRLAVCSLIIRGFLLPICPSLKKTSDELE